METDTNNMTHKQQVVEAQQRDEAGPSVDGEGQSRPLRQRLAGLFKWSRRGRDSEAIEVAVARREASLLQLKRGYNEVAETLSSVRRHMDDQARRSERMIQLMEGLPDLLMTLPEQSASQTRILENIAQNMKAQHETSQRLSNALASATESQRQVSTHLKQQLDASNQSSREMRDALGGLSTTLGDVNRSNDNVRSAFLEGSQQTRDLFARTQKMMVLLTGAIALIALVAIGALVYMIVTVSTLGPATGPVVPNAPLLENAPTTTAPPAQP